MTQHESAPSSAPAAASRGASATQSATPRDRHGENTEVTGDARKEEGGQERPHVEPGSSPAGVREDREPRTREDRQEVARGGDEVSGSKANAGHRFGSEGRLTALLESWWEREPAVVRADEAELALAGFRAARQVDALGRLNFQLEKDGRSYRLRYPYVANQAYVGYELIDGHDAFRARGDDAHAVLRTLLAYQGTGLIPPARGRVLIPEDWLHPITGAMGTFEAVPAARDARALAVQGISGTEDDAHLSAVARSLVRPGTPHRAGLWAQYHWREAGAESIEAAVAQVEGALARTHGLTPELVRELMRTLIGAAVRSSDGVRSRWRFVCRGEHGEPILLQTVPVENTFSIERAPYGQALFGKRVAVVGCGAIGTSVALGLARSGVRSFLVIDDERLEPRNLTRLEGYLNQAGRLKVDALAEQLALVAPGTEVETGPYLLGREVGPAGLMAFRPDLLINTTAEEIGSDETNIAALALGRPAIFAWVSNGIKAGRCLRIRPGVPGARPTKSGTACYECVRKAAPRRIPSAGPAPRDLVTPWTGAVHDAQLFAAAVTRLAVLTLAGAPVSDRNPDHAVLRFGGVVPTVEIVRIPRDRDCAVCGSEVPSAASPAGKR